MMAKGIDNERIFMARDDKGEIVLVISGQHFKTVARIKPEQVCELIKECGLALADA